MTASPIARRVLPRLPDKYKNLIQACSPHLHFFYQFFHTNPFCILILNGNGMVLHLSGSDTMLNKLASTGIKVGAFFNENYAGTSAPSICLLEKRSCQVMGDEHFLMDLREFSSIAAPIFRQDSTLRGCISLWFEYDSRTNNLIPLLLEKLQDIGRLIHLEEQVDRSEKRLLQMGTVFQAARDGILMVDALGLMKKANPAFVNVLGVAERHVEGHPVDQLFPFLKQDELKKKRLYSSVLTTAGDFEYDMEAIPVLQDQEFIGTILRLCNKKPKQLPVVQTDDGKAVMHDGLIAASHSSRKAIHIAKITAPSRSNILLQGETGTGKEMFAHFIHRHSKRRNGPFVAINCAAIPLHLAESELFGYVSGAFTGASKKGRKGKFELADEGTIFLDEINSLNPEVQKKLLRVIESKEVTPLGGHQTRNVNTRVIAASTADLRKDVLSNKFLPELLYRINAITINIPPLRERREDIELLAEHFLGKLQSDRDEPIREIAPDARSVLKSYDWPGNIRELRNVLEYAVALTQGRIISLNDLPEEIRGPLKRIPASGLRAVNQMGEQRILMSAIQTAQGNMSRAARALGISRSTLYRKVRKYGIAV